MMEWGLARIFEKIIDFNFEFLELNWKGKLMFMLNGFLIFTLLSIMTVKKLIFRILSVDISLDKAKNTNLYKYI